MIRFFARVVVAFVLLTILWWKGAAWLCAPAIHLAAWVLQNHAYGWLAQAAAEPNVLKVMTYPVPLPHVPFAAGVVIPEKATDNTNGLPLYLALLVGFRFRPILGRALIGYAVLTCSQAAFLAVAALRDLLRLGPAAIQSLGIAPWQQYWLKAGYVFSGVILPVLVPVALWAWFERKTLLQVLRTLPLAPTQPVPQQASDAT